MESEDKKQGKIKKCRIVLTNLQKMPNIIDRHSIFE